MSVIAARYSGICAKTGQTYSAGTRIERFGGSWAVVGAVETKIDVPEGTPIIRISVGEGYGGVPREVGDVFRETYWENEGTPTPTKVRNVLKAIRVGQTYYREDGMSFGVGDERGYVYWADCVNATAEEAAPILAAEHAAAAKLVQSKRVDELIAEFEKVAEYPQGHFHPTITERIPIRKGFDLYGGGSELWIEGETLWLATNNGMDGDDWSRNNLRTGGAGAVGRRAPLKDWTELVDLARSLHPPKPKAPEGTVYQDADRTITFGPNGLLNIDSKKTGRRAQIRINRPSYRYYFWEPTDEERQKLTSAGWDPDEYLVAANELVFGSVFIPTCCREALESARDTYWEYLEACSEAGVA